MYTICYVYKFIWVIIQLTTSSLTANLPRALSSPPVGLELPLSWPVKRCSTSFPPGSLIFHWNQLKTGSCPCCSGNEGRFLLFIHILHVGNSLQHSRRKQAGIESLLQVWFPDHELHSFTRREGQDMDRFFPCPFEQERPISSGSNFPTWSVAGPNSVEKIHPHWLQPEAEVNQGIYPTVAHATIQILKAQTKFESPTRLSYNFPPIPSLHSSLLLGKHKVINKPEIHGNQITRVKKKCTLFTSPVNQTQNVYLPKTHTHRTNVQWRKHAYILSFRSPYIFESDSHRSFTVYAYNF